MLAGVVLASALHLPPAAQIGMGCISAGAAALNDLDCGGASAARVLGPVSGALSWLVQGYSKLVYRWTRGEGDPENRGAHRYATHSLVLLLAVWFQGHAARDTAVGQVPAPEVAGHQNGPLG